jgi:dipeptidyl aminopeptidase/acylaminoacyl peptidase
MKNTRGAAALAYTKASPIDRVHANAPPFLVVHGDCDTLAPPEESRRFVAALRAVSRGRVGYAEIAGAQHAFEIFPSLRTSHVVAGAAEFASYVHARRATR